MKRRSMLHCALAALMAPTVGARAQSRAESRPEGKPAAEAVATGFPATAELGSAALVLNGTGTRYKAVFKVYDAALYLSRRAATPEAVIALSGPKRLAFRARRDISGTDLGQAFMRGLTENNSRAVLTHHLTATTRLIEIFSGKARVAEGETFAMDFLPGKGTTFYIAGVAQGAPVGDADFFAAVLRIWLGSSPADWKLKDALLGIEGKPAL